MPSALWQWFALKTCLSAGILGLPAIALLNNIRRGRISEGYRGLRMPVSFWCAATVLTLFLISITWTIVAAISRLMYLNFYLIRVYGLFMVSWPLVGVVFSMVGIVLVFIGEDGEHWKLAVANILVMILSVASLVPPN